MGLIPAPRRSHYPPVERMAILQVKTARAWSLEQTAQAFLVTAATIASWMQRLEEEGPEALVQLPEPVNKFPEWVACVVARLKTLCPAMGKVKLAETLARAGLHLSQSTARRMLQAKPTSPAQTRGVSDGDEAAGRDLEAPGPRLVDRSHGRADPVGDVDRMVTLFFAPAMALLLAGGSPSSWTTTLERFTVWRCSRNHPRPNRCGLSWDGPCTWPRQNPNTSSPTRDRNSGVRVSRSGAAERTSSRASAPSGGMVRLP